MKALGAILLVVMMIITTGCSGWVINGIPSERFRDMSFQDAAQFSAGIVTSGLVHTYLGHVLYLELSGTEYHIDGNYEYIDEPISDAHAANIGRAGFLAQLGVGLLLEWIDNPDWDMFESGYDAYTLFNIGAYPLLVNEDGMGDLRMIERNSDEQFEYGLYTLGAAALLME